MSHITIEAAVSVICVVALFVWVLTSCLFYMSGYQEGRLFEIEGRPKDKDK